jgi:hypothetical protein
MQAEALSTLLGHTPLGAWLARAFGSSSSSSVGFIAAASCLMLPTVLLPSVEALAALAAVGVAAAVTVGCVVSYFGALVGLTAVACSLGKWLCLQQKEGVGACGVQRWGARDMSPICAAKLEALAALGQLGWQQQSRSAVW